MVTFFDIILLLIILFLALIIYYISKSMVELDNRISRLEKRGEDFLRRRREGLQGRRY